MIRFIFVLLFMVATQQVYSQSDFIRKLMDTPKSDIDFEKLKEKISHPSSKFYYPQLFERYEEGDSTLTLEEYRHLYYGYMCNKDYRPHTQSNYEDSLSNLINRSGGNIELKDTKIAINYLDSIIQERPFSLKFLNILTYIYNDKVRDSAKALEYSYKFNMLLRTIFSTGTGSSEESPWVVLYRADAQTILATIGVEVLRRSYITANIEYYYIRERINGQRGCYFDFDPIYTKKVAPKEKRKLEINPLYNPNSKNNQKNKF